MKKIVILLLALSLFACDQPTNNDIEIPNYNDINYSNWDIQDYDIVLLGYGDKDTPDGIALAINIYNFTKENPDIKIKWDLEYDELYHLKLHSIFNNKEQLDIAFMWNGGSRHQSVLDAGEEIDQLQFIEPSNFDPSALIGGGANGELFTIPISKSAHSVMYSNDDLLAGLNLKVATTYNELKTQNDKAKAAGKELFAYPGGTSWCQNTFIYSLLLGRFGGAQHVKDIINIKAKFTDSPSIKTFEFIKTMFDDGILNETTLQTDYSGSLAKFNNKEALYLIDGSWRANNITINNFSWNKFPEAPGESYKNTGNGGYHAGYAIMKSATKDANRKSVAIKLLQYLTG